MMAMDQTEESAWTSVSNDDSIDIGQRAGHVQALLRVGAHGLFMYAQTSKYMSISADTCTHTHAREWRIQRK